MNIDSYWINIYSFKKGEMIVFGKPIVGWVEIMIDDFQVSGSFLTDIPCDALRACINSIKNNSPFILYIDEEGITDLIVSYYNSTYIIREKDEIEYYSCDKDFRKLIKEIVEDIDRDFPEWITEFTYLDNEEEKYKEWVKQLEELLKSAKELINTLWK